MVYAFWLILAGFRHKLLKISFHLSIDYTPLDFKCVLYGFMAAGFPVESPAEACFMPESGPFRKRAQSPKFNHDILSIIYIRRRRVKPWAGVKNLTKLPKLRFPPGFSPFLFPFSGVSRPGERKRPGRKRSFARGQNPSKAARAAPPPGGSGPGTGITGGAPRFP